MSAEIVKIGVKNLNFLYLIGKRKNWTLIISYKKIIKKGLSGNWLKCKKSVNLSPYFVISFALEEL